MAQDVTLMWHTDKQGAFSQTYLGSWSHFTLQNSGIASKYKSTSEKP